MSDGWRATENEIDLQLKGEIKEPITAESRQLCPIPTRTSCDRRQPSHPITKQPQHAINEGATNSGPAVHLQELIGGLPVPRDRSSLRESVVAVQIVFEAGLRNDQQTRQTKMILRICPKPRWTL